MKLVISRGAAGLLLDPGLGKTSIMLAAFELLQRQGLVRQLLVVAPLRVCQAVWRQEAAKWAEFQRLRVALLHGPDKHEQLKAGADILVINYEGLEWLSLPAQRKLLHADMLVVDESTRVKHTTTQRFKHLKKLLPRFRRRYILTGTPVPNGLLDLYGQIYVLDHGRALGPWVSHYRNNFFAPTGYGGYQWAPVPGAEEKIYELLQPLVLRMSAADYLQLPERVDVDVLVDLPRQARAHYSELEAFFYTLLEDKAVTAVNAAVVGGKCLQLANGAIYKDPADRKCALVPEDHWHVVHEAKLDALDELVEELSGKPLLVFYSFDHDRARLLKRYPQARCLTGVSGVKLNAIIDAWNRGELPLLLAQPQSAGHGLNLQGCAQHVAWFGLPWDLEVYDQAVARVHRSGNPHARVFVHHLLARDTVEERVRAVLATKGSRQLSFLSALRSSIKGRSRQR